MKKLFFLICNLFFSISVMGNSIESTYKITFSLVGTLGYATTKLNKTDNTYYIKMEANSVGLAKALSGNRKEVYESRGDIINGILVPKFYTKIKSNNRYIKVKKFKFDHNNKKVYLERNEHTFYTKEKSNTREEYKFYAKNDILTLYFNILELIKTSTSNDIVLHAIGGKEENGRIDVEKLQGEEKIKIQELLEVSDETIIKVTINQKIFSSEKGELFIAIGKDNLCSVALLKDVILFGDIKGSKTAAMN